MNPWSLYDELIAGIPEGITVTDALVNNWAAVRTNLDTVGLAMSYREGPRVERNAWNVVCRELRAVAAYTKSWNLRLAALGVAALNAWYAAPDRLAAQPGVRFGADANFFASYGAWAGSRRTAFVGHFPDIDANPRDGVTVLERHPRDADLPDAACEYVLADAEVVVITGSTLVNKTLPRLLTLSAHAEVHLVGPTAPPAPGCYPPCVREIAGSIVVDPDAAMRYVGLGVPRLTDYPATRMFSLPFTGAPH